MLFYLLAFSILVTDQILKQLVHNSMQLGQSVPLINQAVRLTYIRNSGAAFSLFLGLSPYLVIVGIAAVAAIIYFHWKVPKNNYYLQIALGFVLGGSLGNLVDRILRSYVIDYLDIGFWPVFNFADIMINLGVIMLAVKLFAKEKEYVSNSF